MLLGTGEEHLLPHPVDEWRGVSTVRRRVYFSCVALFNNVHSSPCETVSLASQPCTYGIGWALPWVN
jgi:hypothetical protein